MNGLNQYTAAGSTNATHDLNGNLATVIATGSSTTYAYDVENRLVSASGSKTAELAYDPLGPQLRVQEAWIDCVDAKFLLCSRAAL